MLLYKHIASASECELFEKDVMAIIGNLKAAKRRDCDVFSLDNLTWDFLPDEIVFPTAPNDLNLGADTLVEVLQDRQLLRAGLDPTRHNSSD
ncbi:hypothetical protein DID77_03150 [Candidatus Marinamargulisbacteria bacterium SCGC AG-439-L15]|nr:hypothetical protein DID77_03150 [Candidatus Marinamargulisbacteria bacterium SCGC AG-439-L15]